MEWDDLSPEEQRQNKADQADFDRQLHRTGVDLRAAFPELHEIEEPQRQDVPNDDEDGDVASYTVSHTIDVSEMLETLRRLPDDAGTSAFVAAYLAPSVDANVLGSVASFTERRDCKHERDCRYSGRYSVKT